MRGKFSADDSDLDEAMIRRQQFPGALDHLALVSLDIDLDRKDRVFGLMTSSSRRTSICDAPSLDMRRVPRLLAVQNLRSTRVPL